MPNQNIKDSLLFYPTIATMLLITVLSYLYANTAVDDNVYKYENVMECVDEDEFRKKHFKGTITKAMIGFLFLIAVILVFLLLFYFLLQLEDAKSQFLLVMFIFINCVLIGYVISFVSIGIKPKLYKKIKAEKDKLSS